ncbi:MAG TPA: hypothetical protein VJ818_03230 [Actinomycetota bacterium]|nr:hypothetical protein [Actinomycetota bacterium]
MRLPAARGPLSNFVIEHLRRAPHKLPGLLAPVDDPLRGDDFHLALLCTYLVHGCSFEDVANGWQWNPTLVDFRTGLERRFETALAMSSDPAGGARTVERAATQDRAFAPGAMLARSGSPEQLDSLLEHRALMASTVADVWSYLVPRTRGDGRGAVLAFGESVSDQASDPPIDQLPGVSLARANVLWLLALHRTHDVALAGALGVAETVAARGDRDLASAAERLGRTEVATRLHASAARAAEGKASAMAAELSGDDGGAAAVAKGARWMLAVTRRWASATASGRAPTIASRAGGSPIRSA